jgi:acetyltransferase
VVTDAHQDEGLGTELVRRLIDIGRDEKLERIVAKILPESEGMKALTRHLNVRTEPSPDPNALKVVLDLQQISSPIRQLTSECPRECKEVHS